MDAAATAAEWLKEPVGPDVKFYMVMVRQLAEALREGGNDVTDAGLADALAVVGILVIPHAVGDGFPEFGQTEAYLRILDEGHRV